MNEYSKLTTDQLVTLIEAKNKQISELNEALQDYNMIKPIDEIIIELDKESNRQREIAERYRKRARKAFRKNNHAKMEKYYALATAHKKTEQFLNTAFYNLLEHASKALNDHYIPF